MNVVLFAVLAAAPQETPDPFTAWDTSREAELAEEAKVRAAAKPKPLPGNSQKLRLGASIAHSSTFSYNDRVDAPGAFNSALFLRVAPDVGYFLDENLEIRGSLGFMLRDLVRVDNGIALETSGVLDGGAYYHLSVAERLSLVGGGRIGFYLGGSERQTSSTGFAALPEPTTSAGAILTLEGGAAYRLTNTISVDASLVLSGLLGGEGVPSANQTLLTTTTYTGLGVGIRYLF